MFNSSTAQRVTQLRARCRTLHSKGSGFASSFIIKPTLNRLSLGVDKVFFAVVDEDLFASLYHAHLFKVHERGQCVYLHTADRLGQLWTSPAVVHIPCQCFWHHSRINPGHRPVSAGWLGRATWPVTGRAPPQAAPLQNRLAVYYPHVLSVDGTDPVPS